ncbi:hypothetical protein F5141DRAFT_1164795 [Pisolithus sp. B1]|nr:hypothetical protein F5141DRAFT_1164795 [Pisolithus sp. B1]
MSLMVRSTFLVGVRTKAYAARCPGYYDGQGFAASLVRRQHYLAAQMGLRPGAECWMSKAVSALAREIACFSQRIPTRSCSAIH